jgi:DNA-binding beta-propeller fold protein YncE
MSETQPKPKLQVGGTLNPKKHLYINRKQEEDELFQLLNDREYCNVIASRQVGKSSLVTFIIDRLEAAGNNVAYCDISGDIGAPQNNEEWYQGVLRMLALEFGLDIDINEWWLENKGGTPNQRLMHFFEDVLLKEIDAPVVIIMDEIDFSLDLPYTDDFFVAIRTMYNTRNRRPLFERLTFCLVGVATPNELIKKQRTTPYNIGKTIQLSDFQWEPENLHPLIDYLSTDTRPGEPILERIFHWTSGHPFLTAWMCDAAVQKQITASDQIDLLATELFDNITKVSNHPHFERIVTFLDTRIKDKLDAYDTYEQLLKEKDIQDRATTTHIKLKLAGLVKSGSDGNLKVRNRIYERLFNPDWVRKSKPKLTIRNLKRFAIAASMIILIFTAYFFYNIMIIEPPRKMAVALETQISQTSDIKNAETLYQYLAGKKQYPPLEHNPLLGKYLSGFEDRAEVAMDSFWQRKEAEAAKNWFTALENTSNEADAKRFVDILSGKKVDPNIGRNLKGLEEKAQTAYKDFWARRANSLETRAIQRLEDGDVDRALILASAAAIKRNGKLHPKVVEAYRERGYGRLYRTFRGSFGGWERIDISPDNNSVSFSDGDGIYEIKTAKITRNMRTNKASIRFSMDGNFLADGQQMSGEVRVWDLRTQSKPLEFSNHKSSILDIDFSKNSQYVASISIDNLALIQHTNTGEILHRFQLPQKGCSIRFSPDDKLLAVGHYNGAILFNAVTGEKLYDIAFSSRPLVLGIDFSPDGKKLALATWDNKAYIWDVEKNSQILYLPFGKKLFGIAFSPDGRYVFAGGELTNTKVTARLWDAESGKVMYEVNGHTNGVKDVAYSSNGKWVATVSDDKTARIWDVTNIEKPEAVPSLDVPPNEVWNRFQFMLRYTIDDNDEVIDLWPEGPRQLDGWTGDPIPPTIKTEPVKQLEPVKSSEKEILTIDEDSSIALPEPPKPDEMSSSQPAPLSGGTFTLERTEVQKTLRNINQLMSQVRIRPHFNRGRPDGLSCNNIKRNSIFRKMGLRNGDIVQGLNGKKIKTVDDVMFLYQQLNPSSDVNLAIKRRGRTMNLHIHISESNPR